MTIPPAISSQVVTFLEAYKRFRSDSQQAVWLSKKELLDTLLSGYPAAYEDAQHLKQSIAPEYNIFSILKLHFAEVKFHTPVLANMLDPKGSHAQGLEFFKAFLSICLRSLPARKREYLLGAGPLDIRVEREKRHGAAGQIDIGIYSRKRNNKFAVIIENKIKAPDQFQQMHRYYQYARHTLGLAQDEILMVYLSPLVRKPNLDDLTEVQRAELEAVLVLITYQNEIANLLEAVLKKELAPRVHQTLEQYHHLIQSLWPQVRSK